MLTRRTAAIAAAWVLASSVAAAQDLRPPPYGNEDVAALEAALSTARRDALSALGREDAIAAVSPASDLRLTARAAAARAMARVQQLEAELELAKTAPPRALVEQRTAYDRAVERLALHHRDLAVPEPEAERGRELGARAEAIRKAQAEFAELEAARRTLIEAPPESSALQDRLTDLERLDERIRAEEERLTFAERSYASLEQQVFAAYEAYEAEVKLALDTWTEIEQRWARIKSSASARAYREPAPTPAQLNERHFAPEGTGIVALWRARAASGRLGVEVHTGRLAELRQEADRRRALRDRLLNDTERLRNLEAQRARGDAPEAPAVPSVGSEYARLSARIEGAELRVEHLTRERSRLTEESEALGAEIEARRAAAEAAREEVERRAAALAEQEASADLVFPPVPGMKAEQKRRIANFVLAERTASARESRESMDRLLRREEIRADVLRRRVAAVDAELARVTESDLPRLRSIYYRTVLETAGVRGARILLVLLGSFALLRLIRRGSAPIIEGLLGQPLNRHKAEAIRQQRARTLMSVSVGAARAVIYLMTIFFVMAQIDIDYGPLLVAAGGLSLAVGFGAQSLVKDFFSGFFILLEGQYGIGDVVEVAGKIGVVEDMNLRTTILRNLMGQVHVIPNGEISTTSNLTKLWSRAVVDIRVAYEENVEQVDLVLKRLGQELAEDEAWAERVRKFEVLGVEDFADHAVVLRCLIETSPGEQWSVSREFRRRVKLTFDELDIEIPLPQRVVADKSPRPDASLRAQKRTAIRRFVGVVEADHAAPSVEERDRAGAIANKEAAIRSESSAGRPPLPAAAPPAEPTSAPEQDGGGSRRD